MKSFFFQKTTYIPFKQDMQNPSHTPIPEHQFTKTAHPIHRILITGGPCAGKTTSIKQISTHFTKKGYRVLTLPEVPTMIVESGGMILMARMAPEERIEFQMLLIKMQLYIQDYFTKLASMSGMPAIVLCDRGCMDPYAYVSHEEFQVILGKGGWTMKQLRGRYEGVVFLVTAANGAEKYYTLANNVARSEGLELAKQIDQKTQKAYNEHPQFHLVHNNPHESFEDKIKTAIGIVQNIIGSPKL